jgi:hypothetical protein
MSRVLVEKIKDLMYRLQLGRNFKDSTSHIVFEFDSQDRIIGQSNEIFPEVR